jgi:2'-5' RNA ligase
MKRKIFISINLPDRTKKGLVSATEKWQPARPGALPVKWVKEPNLHITLLFLGFVMDEAVTDICAAVKKVAEDTEIFDVNFDKIELGPSIPDPKMIWLSGEANESLRLLQENVEKALGIFVSSKKTFWPHITLGRIRARRWQELPEKPVVEKSFPLVVTAESVDVMASEFEQEGMEYTIIESCPLN